MFSIDDFWKIFNLIKGETVTGLTTATESVAKSEEGNVSNLFSNVIDQTSFDTPDYNRFRNFLINWYASHRTITSIQAQVSDPFSIPDTHLDELFRSFGFNFSPKLSASLEAVNINKVNFFLDLVNLYKVKGTPGGLLRVLQYFGLPGVDILEYWLQKSDITGNLVFKSEVIASSTTLESSVEIPFNILVETDPHWMMTESQILQLAQEQKINFPSKTPYFGIRPTYETGPTTAIVSRIIQDQHEEYDATGTIISQNAKISLTNSTVSLLELYLSSVYIFNKNYTSGTDDNPFICYDGSSVVYTDIIDEYNDLMKIPYTRAIREYRLRQYFNNFTRAQSLNFFKNILTADVELTKINPTLKDELDVISQTESVVDMLISLLLDISTWVQENITLGSLNLAYIVFGSPAITSHLGDVINFFKPIRARMLTTEVIVMQNRLLDTVLLADEHSLDIHSTFIDWDTANSRPCCNDPLLSCPDSTSTNQYYSRDTYDCGSFYDIGAAYDKGEHNVTIEQTFHDTLICIPNDSTSSVFSGMYDSTSDLAIISHIKDATGIPSSANISEVHWQSGGFTDFDEGGTFDCMGGFDNFQVLVQEISP